MRLKGVNYTPLKAGVSIHASVKDATRGSLNKIIDIKGFNPRICKRCDMPMMFPIQTKMFQSTHL